MPAIVIVNRHEPEHEVGQRLLELAEEKGHDARLVEAQRGEHDAALSFRVPQDVADAFNEDRADRWPNKIENDEELDADQGDRYVAGDAYAADNVTRANEARVASSEAEESPNTPPVRQNRPGKATTK